MSLLLESLSSPKTLARHRLLSIGVVMRYVFTWISVITAASFTHFMLDFSGNDALHNIQQTMNDMGMQWIVYPFAALFLFVSNTLLIMLHISIVTAVTLLLMRPFPLRIQYRQLWRTTALALTFHYIAYSVVPFFPAISNALYLCALVVTFTYSIIAARHFPAARRTIAK